MEFKRIAEKHLEEWKNNPGRKPLILRGARQVGKTTLVEMFARSYQQKIILNLEKSDERSFFENTDDVKKITEALFLSRNISFSRKPETLLFIDEIQESPKAIQLLRYFYEEIPHLHVIAAGSLLEFSMRKVKSFPVGRVEYLYLHPLNFEEYLEAVNHQQARKQLNIVPIQKFAHPVLLDLFNRYAIIGGMPECIQLYLQKNSLAELPRVYESIWRTYQDDVQKYTSNETERKIIKHVIKTAPLMLDQRIKFQNFGNSNYRSREVGDALRSLDDARVIQIIYPTTDLTFPVQSDLKKSPRLQFLDTGIINYVLGIQSEMIALNDLSSAYRGALIPHVVAQEFISLNLLNDRKPNFWIREKRQSSAEIDLVIPYSGKVIPIEIKSGPTGTLKSLHQFIERADHPYAIRMYAGEYSIEKTKTPNGTPYLIMNLPYYLGTKIYEYIDYFLKNYSL
jgi:predicted AAA+ superfamily ATPase